MSAVTDTVREYEVERALVAMQREQEERWQRVLGREAGQCACKSPYCQRARWLRLRVAA